MYSQLSVEKAIAKSDTAIIEVIVAKLNVTAEQGIVNIYKSTNRCLTQISLTLTLRSQKRTIILLFDAPGHVQKSE